MKAKTFYYQLLPIKKGGVDTNTLMVKVSDKQSIQSKEFDCKGDMLQCIKMRLLPDLFNENKKQVVHVIIDFPHKHKTYKVIHEKAYSFTLEENKLIVLH